MELSWEPGPNGEWLVHLAEDISSGYLADAPFVLRSARPRDMASLLGFLERDTPTNLFALSWLQNNSISPPNKRSGFTVLLAENESARKSRKLLGACLLLGRRMAMPIGNQVVCRAFGDQMERRGLALDHIVGTREAVAGVWDVYGADRRARLLRLQRF